MIFLAPIAIDGLTQFLGFRESTNELRIITGSLAGIAIANALGYVVFELKNFDYERTGYGTCFLIYLFGTFAVTFSLKLAVEFGDILVYYLLSLILTLLTILNNILIPLYVVYLLIRYLAKR